MPSLPPQMFAVVLPLAVKWAEEGQALIMQQGKPLTQAEQENAKLAGVAHPEKIRVLIVPQIPRPDNGILKMANDLIKLVGPKTAGLTLHYGIFIRGDCAGNRKLMVHECVHVAQYERLGGIKNFLQQYLDECLKFGYSLAPLEQEAIRIAESIVSKGIQSLSPLK